MQFIWNDLYLCASSFFSSRADDRQSRQKHTTQRNRRRRERGEAKAAEMKLSKEQFVLCISFRSSARWRKCWKWHKIQLWQLFSWIVLKCREAGRQLWMMLYCTSLEPYCMSLYAPRSSLLFKITAWRAACHSWLSGDCLAVWYLGPSSLLGPWLRGASWQTVTHHMLKDQNGDWLLCSRRVCASKRRTWTSSQQLISLAWRAEAGETREPG